MGERIWERCQPDVGSIVISRGRAIVFDDDTNRYGRDVIQVYKAHLLDGDVGPKLPFRISVSALHQSDRGAPQHEGHDGEKPFSGLNAKDRDFRSVLAAGLVLLFATWIYLPGWTGIGWIVAAYVIFGLMLGIDPWSLAVRII